MDIILRIEEPTERQIRLIQELGDEEKSKYKAKDTIPSYTEE